MISLPERPVFERNRGSRPDLPGLALGESSRAAGKTAIVYTLVAALWILVSDRLLFELAPSAEIAATLAVYKGWFFVAITAGLLFWLLRGNLEQRREKDEKLQLFMEHAPVALAMLDRDLRYVTVSRRWNIDYELGEQDLRGCLHYDVFPEIPERWRDIHRRALAGETLREEAEEFQRADGSIQWLRWEVHPWLDAAGMIGGIVLFTENISGRKQAEQALADSQTRLRVALECGRVGTWNWDLSSGRVDCDEAFAHLLRRPREDFTRGGVEFFKARVLPDDLPLVEQAMAHALRAGPEFVAEYRVVRADGEVMWLADRASVERDGLGRPVRMVGACVDVTAMKRIERALHDSENRLREVVETIREVFWISDVAKNRMLYVSPAYEEIWGRPAPALYASDRAWVEGVHPDDRERVLLAAATKQAAGTYDETYRVVRPDDSVRWVRDRAYPVRDEAGVVVRIVGCAEDVTERKKLEEQFLRAQRLEAIGTLASGVAHDLNNMLTPMLMVGPMLRPKLADASDREILSLIERSAQRGADVIRQLLTFSRGIAGERGPVQARHLVKEMVAIMRETFPREISVTEQTPADLWSVLGDATQLHQVLMNLCVNARDAMPNGGRLVIGARNAVLTAEEIGLYAGAAGPHVVLSVTDTGHGVPAEIRARIFEPFFTTKKLGEGTGLGLSTVLGIVKSHGGFVTLESEVGRGSVFHVHLPSAQAEAVSANDEEAPDLPAGAGERILVVDDEPAVRFAMQRVLEKNGYRVMTAADGREAMAIFMLQCDRVRVVVTDLMMPEMGGLALVRALRELNPGLAIIAATGLDTAQHRDGLMALGVRELLPKPYPPRDLLEALHRELRKT